jgi:signal transduction histidine kinase
MKLPQLSLLWKIWLSTSVALTALFAITGLILQRHTLAATGRSLEEEVKTSFQAYESLWRARADTLGSVAAILSSMPQVRAAFGTRDQATIRDTAGELWAIIADKLQETAFFVVADPQGNLVASLERATPAATPQRWPVVESVRRNFPRQVSGFFVYNNELYQLVLTPVYVDTPRGPALINVLVAGYIVNHLVAQRLKESTGDSEFLFLSHGKVFASTLNSRATSVLARKVASGAVSDLVSDGVTQYLPLVRELIDLEGQPIGKLCIFRSFDAARQGIRELRRDLILMWLCAVAAGLGATYLLARRIVKPVKMLDQAAAEVARQNYDFRVSVDSKDELGRLAATFNSMCASLQSARQELIRQERISTIGRLASSIVHDLRNPLAAVYGGAEMLVDMELPPPQVKRLATNIYRASRRIQEMLQDLLHISRGRTGRTELCRLAEVIQVAVEAHQAEADSQGVRVPITIPDSLELPLQRARLERVFMNLIGNALEVLPAGGEIRISARTEGDDALIEVADTGPGISPEIRQQLFQPFVSYGKKNGLGLGLALSRQTVLDHGGEIWVESAEGRGACFYIRLPLAGKPAAKLTS